MSDAPLSSFKNQSKFLKAFEGREDVRREAVKQSSTEPNALHEKRKRLATLTQYVESAIDKITTGKDKKGKDVSEEESTRTFLSASLVSQLGTLLGLSLIVDAVTFQERVMFQDENGVKRAGWRRKSLAEILSVQLEDDEKDSKGKSHVVHNNIGIGDILNQIYVQNAAIFDIQHRLGLHTDPNMFREPNLDKNGVAIGSGWIEDIYADKSGRTDLEAPERLYGIEEIESGSDGDKYGPEKAEEVKPHIDDLMPDKA